MTETPKAITLTDAAAERAQALLSKASQPVLGLRLGIKSKGCSGLSYDLTYAEEQKPQDDVIEDKGIRIFLEPSAALFLLGTEIDYKEDKLQSGFVFNNPNEMGRCGCGESFSVDPTLAKQAKGA